MLSRFLAFAAPAAAFLVVPDMAPASQPDQSEGAFKALPIDDISPFALPPTVQAQTVNVPCFECSGDDASLKFDIKVQDHNTLLVNGFEVYPAEEPPLGGGLTASVSSATGGSKNEELSWVIWWQVTDVDKAQGMHILDFHLGVVGVGNAPVSNVDLGMSLIIGPNGEILIADVKTSDVDAPSAMSAVPACEGLWCSIEQAFDNLFKGGAGCHRHHEQMVANPPDFRMPEEFEGDARHGHHLGKMIKNVAAHIFLPVVMGITAGVGAAVLVMFLCSIVAFVARKLAGRETRYSWTLIPTEVVVVEEVDDDDEKNGLMEGQAPPPAYEAPREKE